MHSVWDEETALADAAAAARPRRRPAARSKSSRRRTTTTSCRRRRCASRCSRCRAYAASAADAAADAGQELSALLLYGQLRDELRDGLYPLPTPTLLDLCALALQITARRARRHRPLGRALRDDGEAAAAGGGGAHALSPARVDRRPRPPPPRPLGRRRPQAHRRAEWWWRRRRRRRHGSPAWVAGRTAAAAQRRRGGAASRAAPGVASDRPPGDALPRDARRPRATVAMAEGNEVETESSMSSAVEARAAAAPAADILGPRTLLDFSDCHFFASVPLRGAGLGEGRRCTALAVSAAGTSSISSGRSPPRPPSCCAPP